MSLPSASGRLPTRDEILEFLKSTRTAIGKREIRRAFGLTSHDGKYIKTLLSAMEKDGILLQGRNRRYQLAFNLPPVLVAEISGLDEDGIPLLVPIKPEHAEIAPEIRLKPDKRPGPAPGTRTRLLIKISKRTDGFWARAIRKIESPSGEIFGVFRGHTNGGRIEPIYRKKRGDFLVAQEHTRDAKDGDIVSGEILPTRAFGLPTAKIIKIIGNLDHQRSIGDLVLAANDIPYEFPSEILESEKKIGTVLAGDREDLRALPLVTIDGEDARDFDDAVCAVPIKGASPGWRIVVAIADVSFYVPEGSLLDVEAQKRGNSVYLPDRVVPMLPEFLSNDLCSLVPDEDRYCLAVEIDISLDGEKLRHKFIRGIMRSAARLTYSQMQEARDNRLKADLKIEKSQITSLYGAYESLFAARQQRGTIDLDLPERKIILDQGGNCKDILQHTRLDSHRLVEEFMILANICAAETLQERNWPCMFRVHEDPAPDRVSSLREYLKTFNLRLAGGQAVRPRHFAQLIGKLGSRDDARGIQEAILRTQSQAVYSPDNIGHFGLALRNYAHFTSPIRRYSDLLVHRSLIGALKLGPGKTKIKDQDFQTIGKHLSMTERRAATAERDAFDRYAASYLSSFEGQKVLARVTGVEKFGVFVELNLTGADALLPLSEMNNERYRFDETKRTLVGTKSKNKITLGDKLSVFIKSADKQTGSISVSMFPINETHMVKGKRTRPGRFRRKKRPMTVKS
jgi:ribonuclease R